MKRRSFLKGLSAVLAAPLAVLWPKRGAVLYPRRPPYIVMDDLGCVSPRSLVNVPNEQYFMGVDLAGSGRDLSTVMVCKRNPDTDVITVMSMAQGKEVDDVVQQAVRVAEGNGVDASQISGAALGGIGFYGRRWDQIRDAFPKAFPRRLPRKRNPAGETRIARLT